MKKTRNGLIQIGVLVALGAAMAASSILPRDTGRTAEPTEVSVVIRESDSTLWANTRLGMEQAAAELQTELRFLTLPQANDPEAQLQVLRWEGEQGADALVVVPADPAALSLSLIEAPLNRPLVSMESPMEGAALTVAPDNGALGRALAMAALEDWRSGAVLLLCGSRPGTGPALRAEAARQTLLQAGIRVQWADLAEEGDLRQLLESADAAAVLVFEPALTEQVSALKESLGLEASLYGVGVTAAVAARLERGSIAAVAAWSDFVAGYLAVERAVSTARGQEEPMEQLPFFVVRGDEIYDPEYQKLLFPVTA